MEQIATVAFEHVQGPQWYRVEADALAAGAQLVGPTRFGLAVGRLVACHGRGADDRATDLAWPASEDDLGRHDANLRLGCESLDTCERFVQRHRLPMKLAHCFWSLDRRQVTFFYTAPGRVDFRALLRDLVREFRAPLRLEQVGERDVARLLGGLGRCGRAVCCQSWLPRFEPISINHAREQGLPPVPSQLAGLCCRLRCCLRYELDDPGGGRRPFEVTPETSRRPVKTASWRAWEDDDETDPHALDDPT